MLGSGRSDRFSFFSFRLKVLSSKPTQEPQQPIVPLCNIQIFNNVDVPAIPANKTKSEDSPSEDLRRIILMC
jgi:hypothetical protein